MANLKRGPHNQQCLSCSAEPSRSVVCVVCCVENSLVRGVREDDDTLSQSLVNYHAFAYFQLEDSNIVRFKIHLVMERLVVRNDF